MIDIVTDKVLSRLRRFSLAAQGLLQERPFGTGRSGARNAIQHLGYLQIDSISVIERAHHHVLHSRVPGFKPSMTNELLRSRAIFEYWSHAAAFLPMEDYRFSLPYKRAIRDGQVHWYRNPDTRLMKDILARIRSDGPLRSRDLEARRTNGAGWWDWKPAKKAIEHLYMRGDLMVCDREGFEKSYDLTERVLPSDIDTRPPDPGEMAEHLLDQQLRSNAFVSLKGLTYLRRIPGLREAARELVNERVACGELQRLRLPSGAVLLCVAGTLEQALPRVKDRVRFLSPFDNGVIQRERLSALFAFSYQLECYLPAAKRRYGYFSLPILYRDQFVGRMDCKAFRRAGQLEIRGLHLDHPLADAEAFLGAFARALDGFSAFQGCASVVLGPTKEVLEQTCRLPYHELTYYVCKG